MATNSLVSPFQFPKKQTNKIHPPPFKRKFFLSHCLSRFIFLNNPTQLSFTLIPQSTSMSTYLRKFLILIGCNVDETKLDLKLDRAQIFFNFFFGIEDFVNVKQNFKTTKVFIKPKKNQEILKVRVPFTIKH